MKFQIWSLPIVIMVVAIVVGLLLSGCTSKPINEPRQENQSDQSGTEQPIQQGQAVSHDLGANCTSYSGSDYSLCAFDIPNRMGGSVRCIVYTGVRYSGTSEMMSCDW